MAFDTFMLLTIRHLRTGLTIHTPNTILGVVVPWLRPPNPESTLSTLFAYYTAVERGLDPDKPRHLTKAVTVE